MFYYYEIVNNNNEDILYLYLNMKYEFSNDFNLDDDVDLCRRASSFIVTNNIPFNGNKVYLIVDGVVVKAINIIKTNNNYLLNTDYSYDNYMISIKLDDNSLCEITLRDFLISALLSKYMDFIPDEVYKSLAVLYNTYAYKMMKENGFISNSNFFVYKPINHYRSILLNSDTIIDRLNNIINEVECMYLSYNGDYILPFIHYSNNGSTITNPKYPYLVSVSSLWDMLSPYYIDCNTFSFDELSKKFDLTIRNSSYIEINENKDMRQIIINNNSYSFEEFRDILGLKSKDMYFIINKDNLEVITRGYGNFYGLSLFGASQIAKNGAKYYHILNYYFPSTKLFKYIKELS